MDLGSFILSAAIGLVGDLSLSVIKSLFKKDSRVVLMIGCILVFCLYVLSWFIIITGAALSGPSESNKYK